MKKLLAPILALLAYLSFTSIAFAQLSTCPPAPFSVLCFQEGNLAGILGAAISFIFIAGVVIALFFLLTGGVLRLTFAGADKITAESARNNIVASIVGLIILFLTFLIINIVLGFFNVNITNIAVPHIPTT